MDEDEEDQADANYDDIFINRIYKFDFYDISYLT